MTDFECFLREVTWFNYDKIPMSIGETNPRSGPSEDLIEAFPAMSELLGKSRTTEVIVGDKQYELLAWTRSDGVQMGWLCPKPPPEVPAEIFSLHRLLLGEFGGIEETFNQPDDAWTMNQNSVLILEEALNDASQIEYSDWLFEEEDLEIPIQPSDYHGISREANSDMTICHRTTGEVLLLAHDHGYSHAKLLPGCPEGTLYTLDGAPTFTAFVDIIAKQWLAEIRN
ncbi:hypothetical protein OJ996_20765 [Luteolibacter sp. GHJ8]|uniref:SMI1/KNR4 family protein n=1 Tax=Luteolibacter rhizosphaerae TaxID=2989719 RepID=A0ABT3G845_9BACT|nr:hypothetical protein [Luteolibacter rhizosphaerae]MCW1916033.1 hypothetical protein [Luteolibacter rhizosphaerae]